MFNLAPVPVPDLAGRTCLVTGAGTGIGAELVRVLDQHGARVFAGVYPGAPAEPLPAAVRVLPLDVTRDADVAGAIAAVGAEAGRLDALVNNAGVITPIGPWETLPAEAFAPAFEVNVAGVQRTSLAALPLLKASRGVIVNAGTGAATTPMEGWSVYCATKAAMHMLTRMMAMELAGSGLRVHFLGIPPTDTAMQGEIRASGLNPISRIPRESLVPVRVPATCMAWLVSDAATSVDAVLLDVRQDPFPGMMPLGR